MKGVNLLNFFGVSDEKLISSAKNTHLFFSRTNHKNQCIAVATDLFFGEVIEKKKKYFGAGY